MDLRIDVHIHPAAAPDARIGQILTAALGIASKVNHMANELDNVAQEVAEARTVMQGAAVMISGFKAALEAAGTDQVKLAALAADLDGSSNALAAAMAANTAAAEEPAQEPAPEVPAEPAPAEPVLGPDGLPVVVPEPGTEPGSEVQA